jgi:HK97 family phage major capsid protein
VAEASTKPENQATFTTVSERVKTIATWIPASRQVLDDFSELMTFIRTMMPYYVNLAEENCSCSRATTWEKISTA